MLRHLHRRPTTSIVVILALATGIGATTALFAVVDSVLLRPLPYHEADRIAQLWTTFPDWRGEPSLDAQWDRIALSWEELEAVKTSSPSVVAAGAAAFRSHQVATGDRVEILTVARGTASLLDVLGIRPAQGRWILPDEEGPDAPRVTVASWKYWSTHLGSDPAAVGRTVRIDGEPFTLVGVLPRGFSFPPVAPTTTGLDPAELWVPVGTGRNDFTLNSHTYETIVRLRSGIGLAAAQAEIAPLLRADESPDRRGARLVWRLEAVSGQAREPLLLLFAAAGTLMLIACGNVALLLLGSAGERAGETRTKVALGASPGRLMRDHLYEAAILACAGGLLGALMAYGIVSVLPSLLPSELPRAGEVAVDLRVLGFAVGASLLTGLVAGSAPAILSARTRMDGMNGRTTGRGDARTAVVVMAGQIALSTVLLTAATLFGLSLVRQMAVDPGVRTDGLLAVGAELPWWKHDAASAAAFHVDALDALAALPGVRAATVSTRLPLSGEGGSWAVAAEPDGELGPDSPVAFHEAVAPSFFDVLRIPIVEGRGFTDADGPDAPRVAIVNQTMAGRLWPGQSPVGRSFLAPNGGRRMVVGVAGDIRHHGLDRPVEASFHEPIAQVTPATGVFLLETAGPAEGLGRTAYEALRSLDADIPAPAIQYLDEIVRASTVEERFRTLLAAAFGWVATLLAGMGLAGVSLRVLAARRREIAIRAALGATPSAVMRVVVRSGIAALVAGLALGIPVALAAARVFSARLYGVGLWNPDALALAVTFLTIVAALALTGPALRTARTRPLEALKGD